MIGTASSAAMSATSATAATGPARVSQMPKNTTQEIRPSTTRLGECVVELRSRDAHGDDEDEVEEELECGVL
jgi:hypothetical protein